MVDCRHVIVVSLLGLCGCTGQPPIPATRDDIERYEILRDAYTALVEHVRSVQALTRANWKILREQGVAEAELAASYEVPTARIRELLAKHDPVRARLAQRTVPRTATKLALATELLNAHAQELFAAVDQNTIAVQPAWQAVVTTICLPSYHGRILSRGPFGLWKLELDSTTSDQSLPMIFRVHDLESYKGDMICLFRRKGVVYGLLWDPVPSEQVERGDRVSTF